MANVNARKPRLHFADGRVADFGDDKLAFAVWLALPKGNRVAFRGTKDPRAVFFWDCVDVPASG